MSLSAVYSKYDLDPAKVRRFRRRWQAFQSEKLANAHKMILAFDPGSVNFAWAVMDRDGNVVDSGMLPVRMQNVDPESLLGCAAVLMGFLYEWKGKVDVIVWERYQTRGAGSKNNETVNLTIGMLVALALQNGMVLGSAVMPATWKNWWARKDGEKGTWYDFFAEAIPGSKAKTVHRKDAAGIGVWFLSSKAA